MGISEPDAGDCIYTPAFEKACTFVRQGRVKDADIFTMASQSTEFTLINRAKMNKLTVKKILADPGYGYSSGWTGECGLSVMPAAVPGSPPARFLPTVLTDLISSGIYAGRISSVL